MRKSSDENQLNVIDGETGTVKPPRRIDLSTLRDCRLEMAAVYRMVDQGQIPSQEGSRRVYMLGEIAKVITVAEMEKRLSELEQQHALRLPGTVAQLSVAH
jgi:hypothetical protein